MTHRTTLGVCSPLGRMVGVRGPVCSALCVTWLLSPRRGLHGQGRVQACHLAAWQAQRIQGRAAGTPPHVVKLGAQTDREVG